MRRHLAKRIVQGGFRHIGHGRAAAGPYSVFDGDGLDLLA
jgi:hypothetical protein